MKIFISHSQKDKEVAVEFKEILEDFARIYPGKQEVFLSSDLSSDQIKTGQWKADFEEHLKDSTHFVVLVTPNSLHSTWVTYEIGYALARGLEIIPIGIRGVSPDSFFLNSYSMQFVKDKQDVIKLLSRIFGSTEKFNKIWCVENEDIIKKLLVHCTDRCVYFVGSVPTGKYAIHGEWKKDFVKQFLTELTEKLLNPERGIKVSSFPDVPQVGEVVFDAVDMDKYPGKYEISGLYNLDKIAEKKNVPPETWRNTLNEFRLLYLKSKSSMIIIGGGTHTDDEYKVAEGLDHLEIFPIPCMGGFAKKIFEEKMEKFKRINHPCIDCYVNREYENKEKCDQVELFSKRLGKYIQANEDERES